jgi:gas vesicle protein
MSKKASVGSFLLGAAVGAGALYFFNEENGAEHREELKKNLEKLVEDAKKLKKEDVEKFVNKKVKEIKKAVSEIDGQEILDNAKAKALEAKEKAQELVEYAKEKGTDAIVETSKKVLKNTIKVSKEALAKLENE